MPSITLKNIPEEIYLKLKQSAERNRRSINGEAIFRLETALRKERPDVKELQARAQRIRESHGQTITNDEIDEGKRRGRE